jgi:replicative DNA helicase
MDQGNARNLPLDIECEQGLLGSLIVSNELIEAVSEILEPEDLYDGLHQRLFEMIVHLHNEGAVTPLILHSVMKHDGGLQEVGGHAYIAGLASAAPALPNIVDLAQILKRLSQRRAIIRIAEDAIDSAYENPRDQPAHAIAEHTTDALAAVMSGMGRGARHQTIHAYEAADNLLRRIQEQALQERPLGIKTGIGALDRIIGALLPGTVWYVGGRPGMGKSIIGTTLCLNAARQGFPADYYSGEMGDEALSARMLCDIDYDRSVEERLRPLIYQHFQHLNASGGELERATVARNELSRLPIEIMDAGRLTVEWIDSNCRRRARMNPGTRLVVVDHLQKVSSNGVRRGANRVEEITQITGSIATLAKDLGWVFVVLSQLGREIESRDDKHPRQSDFRESGSIEQDADGQIGIMRPERYTKEKIRAAHNEEQRNKAMVEDEKAKDVLEIGVLKNRAGAEADYFEVFIDKRAAAIRDERPSTADMRLEF